MRWIAGSWMAVIALTVALVAPVDLGAATATSTSGDAFAWGYNCCGEIGDGSQGPSSSPLLIRAARRTLHRGYRWTSVCGGDWIRRLLVYLGR
jgi:hypothetical protein